MNEPLRLLDLVATGCDNLQIVVILDEEVVFLKKLRPLCLAIRNSRRNVLS